MSSALEQDVMSIVLNNCLTLVVIVVVGYDYFLTFSDEVEYIWEKPWTHVSTLFVLVRYFGLCDVICYSFLGSSLLPGSAKTYVLNLYLSLKNNISKQDRTVVSLFVARSNFDSTPEQFKGGTLFLISQWAQIVFICSADLSMILRVWALHNRSRLLFLTLLMLLAVEMIPYLIFGVRISVPSGITVASIRVLDYSLCDPQYTISPVWTEVIIFTQMTLGALMFLLVVVRFTWATFQTYKATGHFHLNRYINLLVKEGMVYFLFVLAISVINIMVDVGNVSIRGWRVVPIAIMEGIPPFTLVSRFILGLRKLYARNLQRTRGNEFDTAFGLASASDHAVSAIMFADAGQDREGERGGQMQMEWGTRGTIDISA